MNAHITFVLMLIMYIIMIVVAIQNKEFWNKEARQSTSMFWFEVLVGFAILMMYHGTA